MDILLFLGGFLLGIACLWGFNYAVARRANSLYMKEYAGRSNAKQKEKAERTSEAMAKVVLIMKDESIPKEEKIKHLLPLAGEYPDVAMSLVKDLSKNGGLGGLF